MRILYFDIDGVLLHYDDRPKEALVGGTLEARLKAAAFDRLVCVSGWSQIVQEPLTGIPAEEQLEALHRIVAPIFPDKPWFLSRLALIPDPDHRCREIDLGVDWYYVDDWADKFFPEEHGEEAYRRFLGSRVHLANPHGDGHDLLEWMERQFPRP